MNLLKLIKNNRVEKNNREKVEKSNREEKELLQKIINNLNKEIENINESYLFIKKENNIIKNYIQDTRLKM